MKKIAVMLVPGYEEGEALFVVGIIRRGGFEVDAIGLEGTQVTGVHDIAALADKAFDGSPDGYDMVVLPGGPSRRSSTTASCLTQTWRRRAIRTSYYLPRTSSRMR